MDMDDSDAALLAGCERAARFCAWAVAALGFSVFLGWTLDLAVLKSVRPELVSMAPTTALGFLLAGGALLAAGRPGWRRRQRLLAATVMLLGLFTLAEYVLAADFCLDQLFLRRFPDPASPTSPGCMANATAVAFSFTGLALALLARRRGPRPAQLAALAGLLIGLLALLGYAFGSAALYDVGAHASVALNTAAGLTAINLGVLLARPRSGIMAVVSSTTAGGIMARRLLPMVLVAPFLIGWLRIQGEYRGLFSSEFGIALVAVTYMTLFSLLVWRTAAVLRQSEHRRLASELALRESEQRYRTLAAGTFEGVAVSEDGRFVDLNAQLARMLGYEREELIGRPIAECLPPEVRERVMANVLNGTKSHIEHEMLRQDGSRRLVETHGETIVQQGRCVRLSAIRDITERRRHEDALRAATAEAERANDAKSRFLAAASHDLRQPLAAISLYAGALKSHLPEAAQPTLSSMKACIASLSELLNDLLDLSKLDAGVVVPKPGDFALGDVLTQLASVHRPEASLKGLRLRCAPTRWTVRTDPVLFGRLLGNFIANAIRYTERGGVLVGCRRREGKTWVEVWDTGVGIPPGKTAEIFEEFHQLGDGARNRGSGLGLAIVTRTAALLGLAIRVRSRPGRGSLFAIEVPLGQRGRVLPAREAHAGSYRPLRIALVEDNLDLRQALALSLQEAGHTVVAAASGAELQAKLRGGFVPDILLSDYRLARGETGFEVIAAARTAVDADLPALLITGETDPGLVRGMADRSIVVLHKPVDLETLQAYLEDLTFKPRALA